jgi:hypothetical protein
MSCDSTTVVGVSTSEDKLGLIGDSTYGSTIVVGGDEG